MKIRKNIFKGACVAILTIGFCVGCGSSDTSSTTAETTAVAEETTGNNDTSSITAETTTVVEETTESSDVVNESKSGYDIAKTLEKIGETTELSFDLSDSQKEFINSHLYLFPSDEDNFSELENYIDYDMDYAHMTKNPDKYSGSFAYFDGIEAVQVAESDGQNGEYSYITSFNLMDQEGNSYYVYYIGESVDVVDGDYVRMAAMPLANASYENLYGNQVLTLIMVASYAENSYAESKLGEFTSSNEISNNKTFTSQYDVAENINSELKYDYEDIALYSYDHYGISLNSVRQMISMWYFAEDINTNDYSDRDLMLLFETLSDAYSYMINNGYVSMDYTDKEDIRYMLVAMKASVLTEEDVDNISDDLATILYAWMCDYDEYDNQIVYDVQAETDYGNEDFILPYSSSRYYTKEELLSYTKEELRLARNEIYAWHGRLFDSEDLKRYFNSKTWYNGYLTADEFDDGVLNDYEKANLLVIKAVEDSK